MPDWPQILRNLVSSITYRLSHDIHTTEDTVRYYFFLQLVDSGVSPDQMILERPHPHPAMQQKEIDLSVIQPDGIWDFEIKYHRPIPSGRNRPRTQLRGQLVSDFYKLAMSDSTHSYVLYIADPKMAAHWETAMPELRSQGQNPPPSLTSGWLAAQPITLRNEINRNIGTIPEGLVVQVATTAVHKTHEISAWLYEVTAVSLLRI